MYCIQTIDSAVHGLDQNWSSAVIEKGYFALIWDSRVENTLNAIYRFTSFEGYEDSFFFWSLSSNTLLATLSNSRGDMT